MKRLIKLISSIDDTEFVDIFFVISSPAPDIRAFESVPFVLLEDAQSHCDYLNAKYNTSIYRVYRTSMFVG